MVPLLNILPDDSLWLPLFIFAARVTDVSIGTIRIIAVTRGQRKLAVVLAFFEVLIWVSALTTVFSHLDNWLNVLGFAAGFATGNAVGMAIERKLAMGQQIVTFLSRSRFHAVAERLRFSDLEVTTVDGNGRSGPVSMCVAVIPRKHTPAVIAMAREIDPEVQITVEDVRESTLWQPSVAMPGKTPFTLAGFMRMSVQRTERAGALFPQEASRPPVRRPENGRSGGDRSAS